MTVLVTGAAGFLGARVAADLVDAGHDVVGADVVAVDAAAGDGPAVASRWPVEVIDVRDRDALRRCMVGHGVTSVVHGGGISGPHVANDRPAFVVDVNVTGTTTLFDCARELELPGRVVLLSSSSTYGHAAEQASIDAPCVEGQALLASEPYGASKVASEAVMRAYVEECGLDAVALRVSIVYGAGRGWTPQVTIEAGVAALVEHARAARAGRSRG